MMVLSGTSVSRRHRVVRISGLIAADVVRIWKHLWLTWSRLCGNSGDSRSSKRTRCASGWADRSRWDGGAIRLHHIRLKSICRGGCIHIPLIRLRRQESHRDEIKLWGDVGSQFTGRWGGRLTASLLQLCAAQAIEGTVPRQKFKQDHAETEEI